MPGATLLTHPLCPGLLLDFYIQYIRIPCSLPQVRLLKKACFGGNHVLETTYSGFE